MTTERTIKRIYKNAHVYLLQNESSALQNIRNCSVTATSTRGQNTNEKKTIQDTINSINELKHVQRRANGKWVAFVTGVPTEYQAASYSLEGMRCISTSVVFCPFANGGSLGTVSWKISSSSDSTRLSTSPLSSSILLEQKAHSVSTWKTRTALTPPFFLVEDKLLNAFLLWSCSL